MSRAPTPAPSIDGELKTLLRRVKLGRCLDTLPERLALARAEQLPHALTRRDERLPPSWRRSIHPTGPAVFLRRARA